MEYVYAGGQRIAEARPGEPLRYYVTDHLGSVRAVVVDENGDGQIASSEVQQQRHYYPYGLPWGGAGVNQQAGAADERYIAQCRVQGFYPLLYYPHNLNFLWFAAMMGGESSVAVETARKIQEKLTDDMVEAARLKPTLTFALVRFGRWDEILDLPAPPKDDLYSRAMWHYGRGLADLHRENADAASDDISAIVEIAESEAAQDLEQPYFHGLTQVRIARHILEGEYARVKGDHDGAISYLQTAVDIQDGLPYMEPPYWFYPTRHTLGAALLDAGRYKEAEAVYREDLDYFAENGWSLHGLAESLRAQNRMEEADVVQERFNKAWARSDVVIARSSF